MTQETLNQKKKVTTLGLLHDRRDEFLGKLRGTISFILLESTFSFAFLTDKHKISPEIVSDKRLRFRQML